MSARITIQSGIAAGTSHRVKGRVARVGSDPQSDICLPSADVPAHALTLEFQNEGCRVYNRCRSSVYVGSLTVEPDEVAAWPESDILQLGDDIELLLDFNEDEPDTFPTEYDDVSQCGDLEPTTPLPQTTTKPNGAKTVLQLAVTAICLIGCVLLLVRDRNRSQPIAKGPAFTEVITASLESDTMSRDLLRRVQHAEALRVRGRESDAMRAYQRIRDDLLFNTSNSRAAQTGLTRDLLRLVQERIGAGG